MRNIVNQHLPSTNSEYTNFSTQNFSPRRTFTSVAISWPSRQGQIAFHPNYTSPLPRLTAGRLSQDKGKQQCAVKTAEGAMGLLRPIGTERVNIRTKILDIHIKICDRILYEHTHRSKPNITL